MFTGIIEEVGEVVEAGAGTLRIRAPKVLSDAQLGDSIAINGVDLTVAEMSADTFFAHVMDETYRRSNLGELRPGDRVNLERSVRPTDRLSGHIVRGVVEGVARIESFTPEGESAGFGSGERSQATRPPCQSCSAIRPPAAWTARTTFAHAATCAGVKMPGAQSQAIDCGTTLVASAMIRPAEARCT